MQGQEVLERNYTLALVRWKVLPYGVGAYVYVYYIVWQRSIVSINHRVGLYGITTSAISQIRQYFIKAY